MASLPNAAAHEAVAVRTLFPAIEVPVLSGIKAKAVTSLNTMTFSCRQPTLPTLAEAKESAPHARASLATT